MATDPILPRAIADGACAERDLALCRSLICQALSLGFQRPEGPRRMLRDPEGTMALAEAAAAIDARAGGALGARVLEVGARDASHLEAEHDRLFGHTARGAVPPYETEYGDDTLFLKPQEMSDIAGFLAAFGLALDPRAHERIDHVACELELMAFLLRKEAHAVEIGDAAMLQATRAAQRAFLKDHLGRFAPAFAAQVARRDPGGFYGALAGLLAEHVRAECVRHGIAAGAESLRLRLPIDDGSPLACGASDGCDAAGSCSLDAAGHEVPGGSAAAEAARPLPEASPGAGTGGGEGAR